MQRELEASALPDIHKTAGKKILSTLRVALTTTSRLCCCVIQSSQQQKMAAVSLHEAHEQLQADMLAGGLQIFVAGLQLLLGQAKPCIVDQLIDDANTILEKRPLESLEDAVQELATNYNALSSMIDTEIRMLATTMKGAEWWSQFYQRLGRLKYVLYALGAATLLLDGGIIVAHLVAMKSAIVVKGVFLACYSHSLLVLAAHPPELCMNSFNRAPCMCAMQPTQSSPSARHRASTSASDSALPSEKQLSSLLSTTIGRSGPRTSLAVTTSSAIDDLSWTFMKIGCRSGEDSSQPSCCLTIRTSYMRHVTAKRGSF